MVSLATPNLDLAYALSLVGVVLQIPGQDAVLYLRLRLLLPSEKTLRVVLIMAVVDVMFVEIPYDILQLGVIVNKGDGWTRLFETWSKGECIIWAAVDMSFTVAYMVQVRTIWHPTVSSGHKAVLVPVLLMGGVMLLLDLTYVVFTFAGPLEVFFPLTVRLTTKVHGALISTNDELIEGIYNVNETQGRDLVPYTAERMVNYVES